MSCQLCCRRKQGPMNYNLEAGFGRRSYRITTRALMVAFAAGWGLITIVVLMQDHAIDAQRELIQLLMQDLHTALTTSVSHGNTGSVHVVVHKVELPSNQVQTKSAPSPDVQLSPSQPKVHPNTEGSTRNPSSQGKSATASRSSRQAKERLPVKPPAQFTDPSDMRRVTFSI